MKAFETMNDTEMKEVIPLFANWLKPYTHEVIVKVLEMRNVILNNEFAMNLLKELATREAEESKRFADKLGFILFDYDSYKEHDPHNNPLTHAGSYRDILYDMYIR